MFGVIDFLVPKVMNLVSYQLPLPAFGQAHTVPYNRFLYFLGSRLRSLGSALRTQDGNDCSYEAHN